MRTLTLAGLVILLTIGCTPDGDGTATQDDATTRDTSTTADATEDIADTVPPGGACADDHQCADPDSVCSSGVCDYIACRTDAECEGERTCAGTCIRPVIPVGPGGVCTRDAACPADYICDQICAQRTCQDPFDCGPNRTCSPDDFCTAQQCITHDDCPQDGGRVGCFNSLCLPVEGGNCIDATDCVAPQDCNLLTSRCYSP